MTGFLFFFIGCGDEIKTPTTTEEEGNILLDEDGDTFYSDEDCDDNNPLIYPSADEICDGIDNNCNDIIDEDVMTTYYQDLDGDGFGNSADTEDACSTPEGYSLTGTDCDDDEPLAFPGSIEACDSIDNNCDGEVDEGVGILFFSDLDSDGYGDEETPILSCELRVGLAEVFGDCDDSNSTIYPEAPEICDELDNDCDAEIDEDVTSTFYADVDNDGYGDPDTATELCSLLEGYVGNNLDCNDIDTNISPLMSETCDEVDNNCDGNIDEGVLDTFFADQDGDTYGDASNPIESCTLPTGYVSNDLDCSDSNAFAWTELAVEICDGEDNDCDEEVDEDDSQNSVLWYEDSDGDNFGNPDSSVWSCAAPDGYVLNSDDCDDTEITISPIGIEFCDDTDNNCDGVIDESAVDSVPFYEDGDEDGFGEILEGGVDPILACSAPDGFVELTGDCNDRNETIHPDVDEACDGIDNNCDDEIDNDAVDRQTYFIDEDGDGFGSEEVLSCDMNDTMVAVGGDCDETSDQIHPAVIEICDGTDNNCDEEIDNEASDAIAFYEDGDEDGFGEIVEEGFAPVLSCSSPDGFVEVTGDCNDNNDTINPDTDEVCDSIDNNCDGEVDEDGLPTAPLWYRDIDQDTYGDENFSMHSCSNPEGYVSNSDDCDDLDNDVYLNATEFCNEEDDDCDGDIDEVGAVGRQTFFLDDDDDGYGTANTSIEGCSAPENYVLNNDDCNDADALTYLGAPEVCSSGDRNCDGVEQDLCESCLELMNVGMGTESGIYTIEPSSNSGVQDVYCDMETDGGGWTQFAFLGIDPDGNDYRYSAIFSEVTLGEVGTGSFKIDSSEMVISASEIRYSQPLASEEGTLSTVDDWEYDFSCDMTPQVLAKILSPGYMNQPAADITCVDLHTGFLSTNAIFLNYQSWSGCWSENRLWIGSDVQESNNYHGNYCVDCVVTWKCSNNAYAGAYHAPSGEYGQAVAFWLR